MTENFSKNSARDAAGLSHPLRSGSPRQVSPQGFAAGFTAIRVRRQVRRRGFAARVRRRGKMFPRQLLSGNYYPSNYYRATTVEQLLSGNYYRATTVQATTVQRNYYQTRGGSLDHRARFSLVFLLLHYSTHLTKQTRGCLCTKSNS